MLLRRYHNVEEQLRGVREYARKHGNWEISAIPAEQRTGTLNYLPLWDGDGAIAPVVSRRDVQLVKRLNFPVVGISGEQEEGLLPRVLPDDAAIGRMAAEHLLDRGFRNLAFVNCRRGCDVDRRRAAFEQRAAEAGASAAAFTAPSPSASWKMWSAGVERLRAFLGSLVLPVGAMMGCDDVNAHVLIDACRGAGLRVPEEVAVIGVGNHVSVCEFCDPPLSSVSRPDYEIGFEAAALLDRLMERRRIRPRDVLLAPGGVMQRDSTGMTAIQNPHVRSAVVYMREHVGEVFGMERIMEKASVSRRRLESLFHREVGVTPHQYLCRVRIDRAEELLVRHPGMKLQDVAAGCGFASAQRFRIVFERLNRMHPTAYRLSRTRDGKAGSHTAAVKAGEEPKRVALLLAVGFYSRERELRGVLDYARSHGNWQVVTIPETRAGRIEFLLNWRGDGAIGRVTGRRNAEVIKRAGLTMVALPSLEQPILPSVEPDFESDGSAAAEHLLDCGLRRLAFVGPRKMRYVDERRKAFIERAAAAGVTVVTHDDPDHLRTSWKKWEPSMARLRAFLRSLTPPAGVMGCDDLQAQMIVEACRSVGLRVPEDVAVIGVDDHVPVAELCNPPLTSVEVPSYELGFQAAALLDRIMAGENILPQRIVLPPRGVVKRASTDVQAIENPHVLAAVNYVRKHAGEAFGVERLVKEARISRVWLNKMFLEALGCTTREYLWHVRTARAREILTKEPKKKLQEISAECGFGNLERFRIVFERVAGVRPADYRRRRMMEQEPAGRRPPGP